MKVEGNAYKCSAQPTQKTSHDFIISLNDIVGSPDNILDADKSNVTGNRLLAAILKTICIYDHKSTVHWSYL